MKNTWKVFDGIVSAEEYFAENTESIEHIKRYADYGCGIRLSNSEAQLVLDKARELKAAQDADICISENDFFYGFEKPLGKYDEELRERVDPYGEFSDKTLLEALEDGEFLATIQLTQEEVEELHDALKSRLLNV